VTSEYGSFEQPVNPLLYVLAYGANFVAQGTPADMAGLAEIVEQAIRYPGFAFVNVQSPCVTFGAEDAQMKTHREQMKTVASLGHDATNRLAAMDLAQQYGRSLHTGVLYRNPDPPPTVESLIRERQQTLAGQGPPRDRIFDRFLPR
jgi:2-oxoglutarate ferredoxin oxidoreductase subunit beta